MTAAPHIRKRDCLCRPAKGDQRRPALGNVGAGHSRSLVAKGFEKCDLEGDVVIIGVGLAHIIADRSEDLGDVFRRIAFERRTSRSAHELRHPGGSGAVAEIIGLDGKEHIVRPLNGGVEFVPRSVTHSFLRQMVRIGLCRAHQDTQAHVDAIQCFKVTALKCGQPVAKKFLIRGKNEALVFQRLQRTGHQAFGCCRSRHIAFPEHRHEVVLRLHNGTCIPSLFFCRAHHRFRIAQQITGQFPSLHFTLISVFWSVF